ncbi:hypothetical protein [Arthrobacter sp. MMS24-S77]
MAAAVLGRPADPGAWLCVADGLEAPLAGPEGVAAGSSLTVGGGAGRGVGTSPATGPSVVGASPREADRAEGELTGEPPSGEAQPAKQSASDRHNAAIAVVVPSTPRLTPMTAPLLP